MHGYKKPFYLKGKEDSDFMDAYLMHMLNHLFRAKDNDSRLETASDMVQETCLDQGFTRLKVMILLPLRSIALRVVKRIVQLLHVSYQKNIDNMERFLAEYGKEDDVDDHDSMNHNRKQKPADYELLFGGNNDDHFMLGIKLTRKGMRLYSDFYLCDIIVASPLALVTRMGEAKVDKEKDVDYLCSIELLIIDYVDVFAMQNWTHVESLVEKLNCLPSRQHGINIMRIRPWYLDGHAKFYRQTILLGHFINPEIYALFNRHCVNYEGKVKLVSRYKGILSKIPSHVRQMYERVSASSIATIDDARFSFFVEKVFPKIHQDPSLEGLMIFMSSYFEFVRLRNFLKSKGASFCCFMDHTSASNISRSRTSFFHGKCKIMLFTERAHFYHRYKIRGVKKLILYSLPQRKEAYVEITNMVEESPSVNCTVLFSQFDKLQLERIVGSSAAERMLSSVKDVFIFS